MNPTSLPRLPGSPDALSSGSRSPVKRAGMPLRRRFTPFGLEALDLMGIDIDQDPRVFAKFLELKHLASGGAG